MQNVNDLDLQVLDRHPRIASFEGPVLEPWSSM